MQNDEIYLIDMWRIFAREWKWAVALFAITLAATLAFTHTVKPQWEATAWIQIGQVGTAPVGQDPRVEPFGRVVERMQLIPFQDDVVKSIGLSPDDADAKLYRKSLKLEPLPYEGPLVKVSVRAHSPQLASQLAMATFTQLQIVHQRLEGMPLRLAQSRLAEVQAELQDVTSDRDRLQSTLSGGTASKDSPGQLFVGSMLANKNEQLQGLLQTRGELLSRLSATYTYETSLMWPIYAPKGQVSPNVTLLWGVGLLAGLCLAVLAAVARNAVRRIAPHRR